MPKNSSHPRGSPEDIFRQIRGAELASSLKKAGRKVFDEVVLSPEMQGKLAGFVAASHPDSKQLYNNGDLKEAIGKVVPGLTDTQFAIGCIFLGSVLAGVGKGKKHK